MKPLAQQIQLFAIVILAALLARASWAHTPVENAGLIPAEDEQLQQALQRASRQAELQHGEGQTAPQPFTPDAPDADEAAIQFRAQLQLQNQQSDDALSPADMQQLLQIRQRLQSDNNAATLQPTLQPTVTATDQGPPSLARAQWGDAATLRPQTTPPQLFADPQPAEPRLANPQPTRPLVTGAAHMREHRCVSTLRTTAMQLDSAANHLEQCELYDQADALRETAQRLRVDARRIAGAPHPPGAGHPAPFGFTQPPAPHFNHPWSHPGDPNPRPTLPPTLANPQPTAGAYVEAPTNSASGEAPATFDPQVPTPEPNEPSDSPLEPQYNSTR